MSLLGEKIQVALSPQVLGFLPNEALTELRDILKNGIEAINTIVERRHREAEKAREK